jgi:hypothetical protein
LGVRDDVRREGGREGGREGERVADGDFTHSSIPYCCLDPQFLSFLK